jgi:Predicted NTP pyrophosphohydrolase
LAASEAAPADRLLAITVGRLIEREHTLAAAARESFGGSVAGAAVAYGDGVVGLMRGTVRAAGGLLWRERDGVVEVALVHRPKHQDWSFPKGKLRPGEHPLAAACREVAEETGAGFVVGRRLPSTTYQAPTPDGVVDKVVDYWSMRAHGEVTFLPSKEVDQLRWAPLDEVADTLTYHRDREVVAAFAAAPRTVATVLLAQPAEPERPEAWDGPDVTRPLTAAGEAYAARFAALLACFTPARVVSAPRGAACRP